MEQTMQDQSLWSSVKQGLVSIIQAVSRIGVVADKSVQLAEREVDLLSSMQQVRLEESNANVESARIEMQKRLASAKRKPTKKAA